MTREQQELLFHLVMECEDCSHEAQQNAQRPFHPTFAELGDDTIVADPPIDHYGGS